MIVQLGGQTPLKLTRALEAAGVTILGTSPDAIDIAEDRRRFEKIARELGLAQPPNGTATSVDEALEVAERDRLSGARAPVVRARRPRDADRVRRRRRCATISRRRCACRRSGRCSIDRFLEDAFEGDVDAISDGDAAS